MKAIAATILFSLCIISCQENTTSRIEEWKEEIRQAEMAFSNMAQEEGLAKAFEHFVADDGVIRRKREVIKGKKDIRAYYEANFNPNLTMSWKPTFIEVSNSGDLAYTYGEATFTRTDSIGNTTQNTGIFHTVWKRQPNGEWKFVYD